MQHESRQGFTLVELSIVMVIIGLLIGGIMAGQSLIRGSQLRSVATEYSRYMGAFTSFREKYNAIPGDMPNAQNYWGAGTCPGTSATPATGQPTCNGNGDGFINLPSTSNEFFRLWQHLVNAGLIEGMFTGVPNSATWSATDIVIGSNIPAGRLTASGWMVLNVGTIAISHTTYFEGYYGHTLYYGAANPACCPSSGIMKPEEMWNIDTKMDDGKPATGTLVAYESAGSNVCHDQTASAVTALANSSTSYYLPGPSNNCALLFRNVFP